MADAPDPDRLKFYSFSVFTQLNGAVTAGMIHLGDRWASTARWPPPTSR
jgi:hypothetical protein